MGGSRTQRCSCFFILSHIALKTHEYQLAAETLDKILKIDPTADLEQILASIAPENAQDRDVLLTALRSSAEKKILLF